MKRNKRSFTLSDDADQLMILLAAKLGISKTAVLELAIREKAERERIEPPPSIPPRR